MDCQSDENTCDEIFDECRRYASTKDSNPYANQVCGIRKNGILLPCKSGCCAGGCPGQCKNVRPRQPYAFAYIEPNARIDNVFKYMFLVAIILTIISTVLVIRKST